jgi:UDP:flavonoid glycosyltransferase YjiC (YdhE family)
MIPSRVMNSEMTRRPIGRSYPLHDACRDAHDAVLGDRSYRERAERMRDALMEQPGPAAALVATEHLAKGRS